MTELERIRHSCAHVLATAIANCGRTRNSPPGRRSKTAFTTTSNWRTASARRFPKIEEEMKKEIKANHVFEKIVVTREQAIEGCPKRAARRLGRAAGKPSKFKLDNLEDIPGRRADHLLQERRFHRSLRRAARDAHRQHRRVQAHAAWPAPITRATRSNPQLQRIYGTAFKNKTEMEAYFKMIEEAKKRDHRKIGAGDGPVRHRHRIRRPGPAAVAAEGRGDGRGIGEAREGD